MTPYVALLRGINVGGRNIIRMADLAESFGSMGFVGARTYIQSGNVLFSTDDDTVDQAQRENAIEARLGKRFGVPIMVVLRSQDQLAQIVAQAPADHGSPVLRSDVLFLKHPLTPDAAIAKFPELREGVDAVAAGPGVVYFSRVDARASQSRLSRIVGTAVYQRMTVRNWRTTTRLHELLST